MYHVGKVWEVRRYLSNICAWCPNIGKINSVVDSQQSKSHSPIQREMTKCTSGSNYWWSIEFFLNEGELSLNSLNSRNLINYWSMNWSQFKDPISHICIAGTVVASWSLTQEVAGWALLMLNSVSASRKNSSDPKNYVPQWGTHNKHFCTILFAK